MGMGRKECDYNIVKFTRKCNCGAGVVNSKKFLFLKL